MRMLMHNVSEDVAEKPQELNRLRRNREGGPELGGVPQHRRDVEGTGER